MGFCGCSDASTIVLHKHQHVNVFCFMWAF